MDVGLYQLHVLSALSMARLVIYNFYYETTPTTSLAQYLSKTDEWGVD